MEGNPKRFKLRRSPTADPNGAADELERWCDQARLQGCHADGLANSGFLDDKRFWPI